MATIMKKTMPIITKPVMRHIIIMKKAAGKKLSKLCWPPCYWFARW